MNYHLDGIAYWRRDKDKAITSWAMLKSKTTAAADSKPAAAVLAASERRRAPETVALALEVAHAACLDAGREAKDLPAFFASSYGDLAVCDAMCSTLAQDPTLVSPIKFHNSVHNAAVGYWTMATGCMHASNALAAYEQTFAQALLETVVYAHAERTACLLVVYDIMPVGALASVVRQDSNTALALVVSPTKTAQTQWSLSYRSQTIDAFLEQLIHEC
ncbi:MAG: hypothetical protein RLZZ502_1122 [Pseudomonadota bacterium]